MLVNVINVSALADREHSRESLETYKIEAERKDSLRLWQRSRKGGSEPDNMRSRQTVEPLRTWTACWKLWCRWTVWPSNLLRSWSIWRPEPHYLVHSIQRPALTFTVWILQKITSTTCNQTQRQTYHLLSRRRKHLNFSVFIDEKTVHVFLFSFL